MSQITFKEIKDLMNEWIRLDYIVPEDIPSIELYMDQITTFMEKELKGNKRNEEDKILTKTMINNYSKNDLLPPSNKKKYSKNHIILLIYIYYLKNFLSINDIQKLLQPMNENYFYSENNLTMTDIYRQLFHLEQAYGIQLQESINEVYEIADTQYPEDDYLKTFTMIVLLSYDIYAKKQLVEKLIDSLVDTPPTKEEQKEAKEQAKQKEKKAKNRSKHKDS